MATTKKTSAEAKLTPAQMKKEIERLNNENEKLKDSSRCLYCGLLKARDKFYVSTDPNNKTGVTPICSECSRKIALRVDKNGEEHDPTKESVCKALKLLNKPFINSLWDSSVQESENLVAGKVKHNPWTAYIKNVAMKNYIGMTWDDSDMFKEKVIYEDEKTSQMIVEEHVGQDTYDDYIKNKKDVVRLLSYDPFEQEAIADQPFLYSQLLGLLDSGGDENDDMMRNASAISIVRGFLQSAKIDNAIANLMSNIKDIDKNSATIKSLQDSKSKITGVIKDLAAESCISLKNNKNAKKGENTWTGKIKKIKDLNLRDGRVNGFDIATCRGMQQVQEISDASIMKQLALDESDWSDMIAEMRKDNQDLRRERDSYKEINRILLQENIDLKDYFEENNIDININLRDLKELYSIFSNDEEEDLEESEEVEVDEQSDFTSI
jgi:hypothetical protein